MQSSFPFLFHGLISSPVSQKDYSISFTAIKREKWLFQISTSDDEFFPCEESYKILGRHTKDNEDIKEILSQTNMRLITSDVWYSTRAIPGDNGSVFLMYKLINVVYNRHYYFIIRREKMGQEQSKLGLVHNRLLSTGKKKMKFFSSTTESIEFSMERAWFLRERKNINITFFTFLWMDMKTLSLSTD